MPNGNGDNRRLYSCAAFPQAVAGVLVGCCPQSGLHRASTPASSNHAGSPRLRAQAILKCSRFQTSAACQLRQQRQQVTPDPRLIPGTSRCQKRPVCSIKTIPPKAARSFTCSSLPMQLGQRCCQQRLDNRPDSSLTTFFMLSSDHQIPTRS